MLDNLVTYSLKSNGISVEIVIRLSLLKRNLLKNIAHLTRDQKKIASLATDTTSEKKIDSQTHVSIHTVRRVVDAFASAVRKRPPLPDHLCFDEFKSTRSVKGTMSFIFCDAVTHQVIDVVEDRRSYYLKVHFYRYSRHERKKVKTIYIDMYLPYIELIRQLFPNASTSLIDSILSKRLTEN